MIHPTRPTRRQGQDLRPVPGYPGHFAAPDGSIWSTLGQKAGQVRRRVPQRTKALKGRPGIMLADGKGRRLTVAVARLVLLAFAGPCPAGMHAEHEDGDPLNCAAANLRYSTRRDAARRRLERGGHGPHAGKRARAAELLAANPHDTDSAVARKAGTSGTTVLAVRREMVAAGRIPSVAYRHRVDGTLMFVGRMQALRKQQALGVSRAG